MPPQGYGCSSTALIVPFFMLSMCVSPGRFSMSGRLFPLLTPNFSLLASVAEHLFSIIIRRQVGHFGHPYFYDDELKFSD